MSNGVFGSYRVEGRVGTGASATVWRAVQPDTDRVVAIKELHESLIADRAEVERLRDEARVLASFDDPHIVRVYDFVEEPGSAWIVEEWVDGAGLDAVVAEGRLTPQEALTVLRGALSGLATAHRSGIVHGDLSPANVLVDADGVSKLVDFGLAAPAGSTAGPWSGTPGYAGPEQLDGQGSSPATDVYAAGVILFELLSGRPCFAGDSPAAVVAAQHQDPVPELPDVGQELNDLIRRATSRDPQERPSDGAEFLAALESAADRRYGTGWPTGAPTGLSAAVAAAVAHSDAAATSTATVSQITTAGHATAVAKGGRRAARNWALAGVGLAAIAAGAYFVLKSDEPPSITGEWALTFKVSDAESIGPTVGGESHDTATISGTCDDDDSCALTMVVGDKEGPVTRSGDTYSSTVSGPAFCEGQRPEIDPPAGQTEVTYVFEVTGDPTRANAATGWAGTWSRTTTPLESMPAECYLRKDVRSSGTVTAKRSPTSSTTTTVPKRSPADAASATAAEAGLIQVGDLGGEWREYEPAAGATTPAKDSCGAVAGGGPEDELLDGAAVGGPILQLRQLPAYLDSVAYAFPTEADATAWVENAKGDAWGECWARSLSTAYFPDGGGKVRVDTRQDPALGQGGFEAYGVFLAEQDDGDVTAVISKSVYRRGRTVIVTTVQDVGVGDAKDELYRGENAGITAALSREDALG